MHFLASNKKGDLVQRLILDQLLGRPWFAQLAANYLFSRKQCAAGTRRNDLKNCLKLYDYLDEFEHLAGKKLDHIEQFFDSGLASGWITYLNSRYVKPRIFDGRQLASSAQSKANKFRIMPALAAFAKESVGQTSNLHRMQIPVNPWPGRHLANVPREELTDGETRELVLAACEDVARISANLREGARILADETISVPPASSPDSAYADFAICLKAFAEAIKPGCGPFSEASLTLFHPGLAKAAKRTHGFRKLESHLWLSANALVPFVTLIAMVHFPSADGLLTIDRSQINSETRIHGRDRTQFEYHKIRGGRGGKEPRIHRRTAPTDLDNLLNPATLVGILEVATKPYRHLAEPRIADRLFLYINAGGRPAGFNSIDGASSDPSYRKTQIIWAAKRKLPIYNLSRIRATGAELTRILTKEDRVAVQVAMGHASLKVGDQHYKSASARRRGREAIAQAQEDLHRSVESGHKIDFRSRHSEPRSAATPGMLCLDMLGSPQPGQVKGRPCTAYGACPGCPLAQPFVDQPIGLARMLQVSASYKDARSTVSAVRWREVLEPLMRNLNEVFIPAFRARSPHLVSAGESISLPSIPPIE